MAERLAKLPGGEAWVARVRKAQLRVLAKPLRTDNTQELSKYGAERAA